MSLYLVLGTEPHKLRIKTHNREKIQIGEYRMSMEDFACFVRYVMTNTDLEGTEDPRLILRRWFLESKVGEGWMPKGLRVELGGE